MNTIREDDELQRPLLLSTKNALYIRQEREENDDSTESQQLSCPPPLTIESSSSSSSPSNLEQEQLLEDNAPSVQQLLRPLQLLFGLNGLALSLQSLALMYVINTRVEIPLAYLPTYGAIAFLPWSLKPLYAYLSSSISSSSRLNNNTSRAFRIPRYGLLIGLLLASGVLSIATCYIPPGGVVLCFIMAFVRGVTDAWAEFCLGLSLIDQARQPQQPQILQQPSRQEENGNEILNTSINDPTLTGTEEEKTYESMAALFQSQAATARNLGALVGSMVTCLLLVHRHFASPDQTQLSGSVADTLLITTGILLLIGSFVTWSYRDIFQELSCNDDLRVIRITTTPTTTTTTTTTTTSRILPQPMDNNLPLVTDEESPLYDEQESHPSYSSTSGYQSDIDLLSNREESECEEVVVVGEVDEDEEEPVLSEPGGVRFQANLLLVILLQLSIVTLSFKDPIANLLSHLVWKVLMVMLLSTLVVIALHQFQRSYHLSWQTFNTHRVGLFLIVRHALPSESMILGSFLFSIFYSTPLLLQFLSLVGMALTTLSSWSYGKLLSRYSRGWQLQAVIGGTTLVASIMSLGNILLVSQVQQQEPNTSRTNDDDQSQPQHMSYVLVTIAFLVKIGTSFAEEWQFLPDVILATASLKVDSRQQQEQQQPSLPTEQRLQQQQQQQQAEPTRQDLSDGPHGPEQYMDTVAIEYGSLISCIDFGDQLGALLAGPLVAMLGISRENSWYHLDLLILICSGCNLLSLPFLGLLRK